MHPGGKKVAGIINYVAVDQIEVRIPIAMQGVSLVATERGRL